MLFNQSAYIGVDLGGRKTFTYAALNANLELLALSDANSEDLLSFIGGQPRALVAVNAPPRPNQGRVRALLEAESLTNNTVSPRGSDLRLAEHELRLRGIKIAATASRPELCPAWIRSGFALYEKLAALGFVSYPHEGDAAYQYLETHPQAAFLVLAEGNLFPFSALEGRLQRQTILYGEGLRIRDPMMFFEEITRHRLRQGILPLEKIYTSAQLSALLAAYTAYLAAEKPAEIISFGDADEGKLYLPVRELKSKY
jgi:hypothetical protein